MFEREFALLGITADTPENDGKLAYWKLAIRYHPDKNPGDKQAERIFQDLGNAWNTVKDLLPKVAAPLPNIDPTWPAAQIEEVIGQWLIDSDAALPKRAPDKTPPVHEEGAWTTVASGGAMVPLHQKGDWTRVRIPRGGASAGLENISPEDAARLIYSRPNAFAALRIVQQNYPELCLYDSILARAKNAPAPYKPSGVKSASRALVIYGAEAVDKEACQAALRNPLASVSMAAGELSSIAPQVKVRGAAIDPQLLGVDLSWLKEHIIELMAKYSGRRHRPGGGTQMARR